MRYVLYCLLIRTLFISLFFCFEDLFFETVEDLCVLKGYTLMHQAVYSGITVAVKTLIDLGGGLSLIRSSKDGTPLQLAQREKRNHLIQFLKPL